MLDFLKGKKDKESDSAASSESQANDVNTNEGDDSSSHGPDVVGGVPAQLKDKLAEIRGESESDFEYHETDDQGNVKKDDAGNPIVITDPDAEEISGATDGETSSGDAKNSSDASEDDGSEAAADTDHSEGNKVTLSPRLEAAGRKMGWPDDKIISVAEADISILEDLANRFEKDDTHRQDASEGTSGEDAQEGDTGLSAEAIAKLEEKLGKEAAAIIISMKKENAELKGSLKEVNEYTAKTKADVKQREDARRYEIASELFDNNAEAFPEFGTTAKLKKDSDGNIVLDSPEIKARDEVYQVAEMFQNKNGGTFSAAMAEALNWHAGRSGTVRAQRQVVQDLNKNKKRFSPKPSSRRMVKVFKTPQAKGANIVAEAKKKAGIT